MVVWFAPSGRPDLPRQGQGGHRHGEATANRSRRSRVRCTPRASSRPRLAFDIDTTIFGSFGVQQGSYEIAQGSSFSHVRSVFSAAPNVVAVDVTRRSDVARGRARRSRTRRATPSRTSSSSEATASNTPSPFRLVGIARGTHRHRSVHRHARRVAGASSPRRMEKRFVKQAASVGLTPSTTLRASTPTNW